MIYDRKTRGRKRGAPNQRTGHRRLEMADAMKDVTRISVPVVKLNMLQRIRYASDFFFSLAEREREKGDRADVTFVVEMMQSGALLAAKAAPYVRPKLAVMKFDSEPQRHSLDLTKLTDEELMALERIVAKSQKLVPDDSTPRTADEYLPSTKPIVGGESKRDARKSVGELANRPTNDEPDSKGSSDLPIKANLPSEHRLPRDAS